MALPTNLATRRVTARYTRFDGKPDAGAVTLTPSVSHLYDASLDVTVTRVPIVITLDKDGRITGTDNGEGWPVPVTDDPDLMPSGFTYHLHVKLKSGYELETDIQIPAAVEALDLLSVTPVAPADGPFSSYVLEADRNQPGGFVGVNPDTGTMLESLLPEGIGSELTASQVGVTPLLVRGTTEEEVSVGSDAPLAIPTYDGSGEVVHPSVFYDPKGWNGKRFWMAATPYPNSDADFENPSIYHSDDGDTWVVPAGVTNPLVDKPGAAGSADFNSDTDLVLGPDRVMYLFFRQTFTGQPEVGLDEYHIVYISSTDGVVWSSVIESGIVTDSSVGQPASPSVLYDPFTGQWTMWVVDIQASPAIVQRYTAAIPDGPWTGPQDCTGVTTPEAGEPWHIEVHKWGQEYHAIWNDGAAGGGLLWRSVSRDGLTWWTDPRAVALPVAGPPGGDLYRTAFWPALIAGRAGYDMWVGTIAPSMIYRWQAIIDPRPVVDARLAPLFGSLRTPPYILGDTVDRPDSTTSPGVASSGQAWTVEVGTAGVIDGTMYSASDSFTKAVIDLGVSDFEAGMQIRAFDPGGTELWLLFRYTNGGNQLSFGYQQPYYRFRTGISGTIDYPVLVSPAIVPADGDRISVRAQGSSIHGYVNDRLVGILNTSANVDVTRIGWQVGAGAVRIDNFYARTI